MKRLGLFVSLIALLSAGCGSSGGGGGWGVQLPSAPGSSRAQTVKPAPLTMFVEGSQPGAPLTLRTKLFESRQHNPILTPQGRHVTLLEWAKVKGNCSVTCEEGGARVEIKLNYLIPNGLYTLWNVTFRAPGFDATLGDPFLHQIGFGTLGQPAGSQNSFRASSKGEAQFSTTIAAGPLSVLGALGECPLTEEFEWHVVGVYHLDGRTHGATMGPDGGAVEQFSFVFRPGSDPGPDPGEDDD